jgi:hypothetical protein
METSERARDWQGRFDGPRVDVESVPRLPTFPARWALYDPRRRPYFIFWVSRSGSIAYALRMTRVDHGTGLTLETPGGTRRRINVIRRSLPRGTGTGLFYVCPHCQKPRRYLYAGSISEGRLVDYFGWRCQECCGLRWGSQGRYRRQLDRALFGTHVRAPLPRQPWDPRAVSDPRLLLDEFPDQLRC